MPFRTRALVACSLLFLASCDAHTTSPPTVEFRTSEETRLPIIALAGRVTDAANVLSAQQESVLSAKLERFEQRTKHQLVIVTVPSLGGEDIASYTLRLANSWGIGRKGFNDGIVLLVAPNDRKVRIATGAGIDDVLTDEVCHQIIPNSMLPPFRSGDLFGGSDAGTDALIARSS